MFTKNYISALMRYILFVAFIMGLLGLHPTPSVLAASSTSGEKALIIQKSLTILDDQPDLIIESITPTPASPARGEDVTFSVVIKNQGQAVATEFYLDLFIDEDLPTDCFGEGTVYWLIEEELAAGASQTIDLKYPGFSSVGMHDVNGIVDTNCDVNESDVTNNTWTGTMESLPTISVESVFTTGDLGPAGPPDSVTQSDPLQSGAAEDYFDPGDPIEFYLHVGDDFADAQTATAEWQVTDPDDEVVAELSTVATHTFPSGGNWWWWIDRTLPTDIARGTYTLVGKITYNGVISTESTTFTVAGPPKSFNKISPANASLLQPSTLMIEWSQSAEAAHYEYCYDTSNDASCDDWITVTIPSATLTGLEYNMVYYWQVRAVNGLGTTYADDDTVWSFQVAIAPPNSISPGSLAPNAPDAAFTRRPTFLWESIAGAANYTLEVVTSPYCSSFAVKAINTTVGSASYTHTADLLANTVYCWRVRANGTNSSGAYSQVRSFTTRTPPTTPGLTAPGNGSLVRDFTPLFDWGNSTVTGGTVSYYRIWVDNNSNFSSPEVNTTTPVSNFTPSVDVAHNTKLYWKVQAVAVVASNEYVSAWSAVRSFRSAVDAPNLQVPTDDFHTLTARPSFDWDAPSGTGTITGYTIKISKNSAFTQVVRSASTTASAYTATADLPKGIRLYWRVLTKGANGPSAWSQTRSFIISAPPSTPLLSSPASNALITTYVPLLQWTAVTLPINTSFKFYQVQLDDNADFSSPVIDDTSITNQLTIQHQVVTPLQQNTDFYWRVRAVNMTDDASSWSAVLSFHTIIQPPSGMAVTLNGLKPSFNWDDATGPGAIANYTVQVSTVSDFSTLDLNATTNLSDYTMLTDLPAGSTIYWRVSVNGANGPSAWTASEFTTP